jgi:hypothetical protein
MMKNKIEKTPKIATKRSANQLPKKKLLKSKKKTVSKKDAKRQFLKFTTLLSLW